MQYKLNKFYKVAEIIIDDGQSIPKIYDKILLHDHDEIHSEININAQVMEILERKINNNKLVLLIRYEDFK